MGVERFVEPTPEKPAKPICECALPTPSDYGAGTIWKCDTCATRWVMTPTKTWRYGLGAWVEMVTVVVPLIMAVAGNEPFGWRRTRFIDGWTIVFVSLFAFIMIPHLFAG